MKMGQEYPSLKEQDWFLLSPQITNDGDEKEDNDEI